MLTPQKLAALGTAGGELSCEDSAGLGKVVTGQLAWMDARCTVVCTENSNTHVVMVKPAEDRIRRDGTDPLNRAKGRSIFVQ